MGDKWWLTHWTRYGSLKHGHFFVSFTCTLEEKLLCFLSLPSCIMGIVINNVAVGFQRTGISSMVGLHVGGGSGGGWSEGDQFFIHLLELR